MREFGFILVQPIGHKSSFNAGVCCGQALAQSLPDTPMLQTIVSLIQGWLPDLGPTPLVVGTGFSNGGMLVDKAAVELGMFHAIAPVGGHYYDLNSSRVSPTPTLMIHSLDDPVVRVGGCCSGARCCCGIDDRVEQCTSVEALFHAWTRINGCSDNAFAMNDLHGGIQCTSAQGCEAQTTICLHSRLGHSFPGHRGGVGIESGPTSPREIAQFLLKEGRRRHGRRRDATRGPS